MTCRTFRRGTGALLLVAILGLPGAAAAGPLEVRRLDAAEPPAGPAFFLNLLAEITELLVGDDTVPPTDPEHREGGEGGHGGGGMDPNGGGGKSEPPPPEPKP